MAQLGAKLKWIFIATILAGCQVAPDPETDAPFNNTHDDEVRIILQRAIASAGGWTAWSAIDSITYRKRSILYLADGAVESDQTQYHRYDLQPSLSGSITWSDSTGEVTIAYQDGNATRSIDGVAVTGGEESARQTFLSAYYVLFIPFKLLDPGTLLTYTGKDTLESGAIADVIKAEYDPGQHGNHSTSDVWWYYFEENTGRHLASLVYHPPTYALIENIRTTQTTPIRFNAYRESYRCDRTLNKQFLRGVFEYSDFRLPGASAPQ
ncbi:MAG: hypothetical protein R3301_10935 [Saprospiraceae bacterium]|nr:hypothetical protein [Saprospiraceae bacterium]